MRARLSADALRSIGQEGLPLRTVTGSGRTTRAICMATRPGSAGL